VSCPTEEGKSDICHLILGTIHVRGDTMRPNSQSHAGTSFESGTGNSRKSVIEMHTSFGWSIRRSKLHEFGSGRSCHHDELLK
jgi:hypothetical protein